MSTEKQIHDLLLEVRPEGAEHDQANCMLCTVEASEEENVATEDQAILSQKQHDVLVTTAVEKASAEATASADAEVISLNEQLEIANKTIEETVERVTALEQEIADAVELERLSGLETDRVAAVLAVVTFSDEQIAKRKSTWANLSEEDFESYLEDIQVAAKAEAKTEKTDPPKTKFDGTRATAGEEGTEMSVINDFFALDLASQS